MAVAITAMLLLLFAPEGGAELEGAIQQDTVVVDTADAAAVEESDVVEEAESVRADTLVRAAGEEARRAVRGLWYGLLSMLPRIAVAFGALFFAWLFTRIARPVLQRFLGQWERASAATALFGVAIWIVGLGIAVSVLAGDVRALVGSLGLVGLALSWALQTPIESFAGWLMNSFQGYYRVGDRVAVGDIFGDVYRIDFLTTTVWEIGSPERGAVRAEQATGRLITFPNSEVLSGSIVNLTRDFPFVWDEVDVQVGVRSDLAYTAEVLLAVAKRIVGEQMKGPALQYEAILRRAKLELNVAGEPQVFFGMADSWVLCTIRFLVPARERRLWRSALAVAVTSELNLPEHSEKIRSVFPRRQIQFIGPDGKPREPFGDSDGHSET